MDQLIMRWKKEGKEKPEIPDFGEYICRCFDGSDEDIDKWLDIVQYGLTGEKLDKEFFLKCMYEFGELEYDKFFIVEKGNEAVATLAVICNYETKEGYIHMVACKPEHRGKGIGTRLNQMAVRTLIDSGMESAYLTTDDFRIPAIRSYLSAGFEPDLSTDEFKERFDEVFKKIAEGKSE